MWPTEIYLTVYGGSIGSNDLQAQLPDVLKGKVLVHKKPINPAANAAQGIKHHESQWNSRSIVCDSPTDDINQSCLDLLNDYASLLEKALSGSDATVCLEIVQYPNKTEPYGMYLSRDVVMMLASLGAYIDCDISQTGSPPAGV